MQNGELGLLEKERNREAGRGPFAAARAGGAGGGFFSEIRFPISFFRTWSPTGPARPPGRDGKRISEKNNRPNSPFCRTPAGGGDRR